MGDVADFSTETVRTDLIDLEWYIGTENMLANCEGVVKNTIPIQYGQVRLYRKGDILISNIRPYLKKIWLATRDGGCSTDVNVIHSKGNEFSSDLLYYALSQDAFFDYIMSNAIGTKMPRGDKDIIRNFEFDLPTEKNEQQKIVSGFSAINNHIAVVQKLISKYESIKKATVNLLLIPSDGWKQQKLSDVATTSSGGTPSRGNSNFFNGNIPWFTTGELNDGLLLDSVEHISEEAINNSSANIYLAGTILLAMYGATIGKLGVLGVDAASNQACCAIRCGENLVPAFLFHLLYHMRDELIAKGCGAGQPNISQQIVRNLTISIPSIDKQRKIAAQISAIDNVLKDCHKQLVKAQSLKQGMMSYFFG